MSIVRTAIVSASVALAVGVVAPAGAIQHLWSPGVTAAQAGVPVASATCVPTHDRDRDRERQQDRDHTRRADRDRDGDRHRTHERDRQHAHEAQLEHHEATMTASGRDGGQTMPHRGDDHADATGTTHHGGDGTQSGGGGTHDGNGMHGGDGTHGGGCGD